ncbi:hypothetical protein EON65_21355 [archaeon]|nr:MAG: hypothetical protein EON65_21355 [archaeon]
MPVVPISGVNVEFPKTPYECQVTYMQKVLQAMSTGSNALLESPTGTGKTLSLLCASLAWQKQHNRRLEPANDKINQFDQFNVSKDNSTANAPTINQNVVIIYATRTHSQLNQVIRELQSTAYRPKMAVLGSREQLCIHDKVSKLKGSAINHACTTLTTQRGCRYRNNLDSDNGSVIHVSQEEVVDIEDLALIGRRKAICPYFYSRDMSANADIIFMPYNYLLDASIRKTTRIPFQNAVVIFDEAHNLEQVSSDAASCTLTSADIAACIKELQQVLATLQNDISRSKEDRNSSNNGKSDGSALLSRPDLHLTMQVLRACFALEQQLDGVQLSKHEATNTMCAVLPGKWLVDLLMGVGFQTDQVSCKAFFYIYARCKYVIIIRISIYGYVFSLHHAHRSTPIFNLMHMCVHLYSISTPFESAAPSS